MQALPFVNTPPFARVNIMLEVQTGRLFADLPGQTMNTIRLLIVDDHRSVRDALQVSLGSKPDLEVLTCDCDLDNIDVCVNRSQPDVVLFEPKSLNGKSYESCRRLLNAGSRPAVIVLTSYHNEQEAMIFTELGVSAYLLKDIDSQSLYDEIRRSYTERKKLTS